MLSLSLLTEACAIAPPDTPVCVELTLSRGWCTNTISSTEYYVDDTHPFIDSNGKAWSWWDMRPLMLRVPIQSWTKIKTFIIDICKKTNECGQVTDWNRTVDAIDAQLPPQ